MEEINGIILEGGEYYRINGTKRVLYWSGDKWMRPTRDEQKRFGIYVTNLDRLPNVKSVELVDIDKIG